MIIVKLQGGLGNQMFQYAAARTLSNSGKVYLDFSFLLQNNITTDSFTARGFELGIFKRTKTRISNPYFIRLIRSKRRIFKTLSPRYQEVKDENIFDFLNNNSSNVYLDGYFQNPLIFRDIRNILMDEFTFPELSKLSKEIELNILSTTNPVAIHIRRGDYTKPEIQSYHGILPLNYYKQGIERIKSKVENPIFYIFSDDANWCKENFSFIENSTIVSNLEPWEDMYLMTACQHHIIANSTFSWWGAWLSTNKKQINIAPKNWFKDPQLNLVYQNIIPKNWIKL
ncbi:alpha-1,2-fucosyltransferase [Pedobacter sp. GR22-10]|uniref:alpha-1,2-fucosyltransferase n=1 Tax=Pedobacter sp. GR22-10 TaxID=2994472 RepID=UPI002247BFCB|nr:alpha-1,2-fucosyltransferase [Pedobacter sp. GR22-10]MCX2431350.1 alpha-1,2-fucosyltransferase [Pedobacter sp. GR22-10]